MKTEFLIDTGADISIFSVLGSNPLGITKSVNGIGGNQQIGRPFEYSIRFSCDIENPYTVKLHQAVIPSWKNLVILGRDFLTQFQKTEFDWENNKIRLGESWLFFMDSEHQIKINPALCDQQKNQIKSILGKYPEAFAKNPRAPRECSAVKNKIKTIDNKIVNDKVRGLPSKWKAPHITVIHYWWQRRIILEDL